jgi:hypothetical protein
MLATAPNLAARAEAAIFKTMETGLTLRAATVATAQAWREEAIAKGWDAQQVDAIRHLVLKVGANIANDMVAKGIITRAQFLAS